MKKFKPLGYYDYTVVLTYTGMLFAFYGIILSINCKFFEALFCLMIAGLCDMLDGAVASTKKRTASEKRFGIQIDSLCDLISFGVLPAIFVYIITGKQFIVGILSAFFALAGLIRLAYYNVLEDERQNHNPEKEKNFVGLPITASAMAMPLACVLQHFIDKDSTYIYLIMMIICGVGYLTPVEIKNPNMKTKMFLTVIGIFLAFMLFRLGRAAR